MAQSGLTYREHRACVVSPYALRPRGDGHFTMGVFDASGECLPDTLLTRVDARGRVHRIGIASDRSPDTRRGFNDVAVYMGPILHHFGHFLLEGLARTWFLRDNPDLPAVWSALGPSPFRMGAALPPPDGPMWGWQQELLALLGLRNPLVIVTEPTRFERLIVPAPGCVVQTRLEPEHAAFLGRTPHEPTPGRKLWLSRSRAGRSGNRSMPEIERRLAESGWTVIHPQELGPREHLAQMASAERIAGEEGSALHTLLLLREPRDLRVDVFLRDPARPASDFNRNYATIAAAKGVRQFMHRIGSETVLRSRGAVIEKEAGDPEEYLRRLEASAAGPDTVALLPDRKPPRLPGAATVRRPAGAPAGFLASQRASLVYVNMPKSACTTIKNVLHRLDADAFLDDPLTIHGRKDLLVRAPDEIERRLRTDVVFTFVREPLRRAYSCFTEKVHFLTPYSFPRVRHHLVAAYGAQFPQTVSLDLHRQNFVAFLRFAEDSFRGRNGWRRDPHWCPQSMSLGQAMRWRIPDFIGRVERFDEHFAVAMALAGVRADFVTPRMNEGPPPPFRFEDVIDDESKEIGARLYEADFRNFGYSV